MAAKKKSKARVRPFILDCSITLAWFFADESDAYAEAVQDSLAFTPAVVPGLWHLEVANALLVGERRKRTTEAKATHFLTLLAALPITQDDQTSAKAWGDTLLLARAHNLSAYDAAYLELAMRLGAPLATLDDPLRAAMKTVGVPVYSAT